MNIITLKDGRLVNADHVVQFATLRNGETKFLLSTGSEISGETYTDLAEVFIPVIQANPGFVAVFADRLKDGTFLYRRRSVIAWQRCPSGAYPIFQGYSEDIDTDYEVIIDPDGGVYDSDKNLYASFEDWKRAYEEDELATATSAEAA